jgi:hypothetical protein
MKYDDASWHYGGDFPEELPNEAASTHIGLFVAWCQLNGLGGELHTEDFTEELDALKSRKLTPGAWFINACDEKFTDEDLSDEGNKFAEYYYQSEPSLYLNDYENVLGNDVESLYFVQDTWESFDALCSAIKEQFDEWKNPSKKKSIFSRFF